MAWQEGPTDVGDTRICGGRVDQKKQAEQLLSRPRSRASSCSARVELLGPNGLLNQLTKNVL